MKRRLLFAASLLLAAMLSLYGCGYWLSLVPAHERNLYDTAFAKSQES